MMHAFIEKLIPAFSRDGRRAFFETASFPWVADLEAGWRAIRAELDALMSHRDQIPNFQDVSPEQGSLTEGDQWKTFFLCVYGRKIERNCARCPETTRRLRHIPGMKTAMFSILAPGKHIPEHRGVYKGVLRYHLGLIIPEPRTSCRILPGANHESHRSPAPDHRLRTCCRSRWRCLLALPALELKLSFDQPF